VCNATSVEEFCDSQVEKENRKVVVYLFGPWRHLCDGADDTASKRWLEVASATAFCALGVKWGLHVNAEGHEEIGTEVLLAVEAVGRAVGLADTHQAMMLVC
jgi:hypothetical protein